MALSEPQVRRYARHILLPDLGGHGQERLLAASVTVQLSPLPGGHASELVALAYLAAAGVGYLRLAGETTARVGEEDIESGILYGLADLGRPRADAIGERIAGINPDVTVSDTRDYEPAETVACGAEYTLSFEPESADREGPDRRIFAVSDALVRGSAAAVQALTALLWGTS